MRSREEFIDQVTVKLERANKHILDLGDAAQLFHQSLPHPYTFSHKDDANTGNRTFYVKFEKHIPRDWPAIIGDAIQNLRSALDHLATRLVDLGDSPRTKHPYYPIFENAEEYEAGKMRKIQGARPDAIKAIDATQPYARGNGWALWDLHTLNNRDKHRLLIPAWGTLLSYTFPKSEIEEMQRKFGAAFNGGLHQGWLKAASGPAFLEDGDPVLSMPILECQEHMRFTISVAFREPEIVKGKQVLPTLNSMYSAVRRLIADFDTQGLI